MGQISSKLAKQYIYALETFDSLTFLSKFIEHKCTSWCVRYTFLCTVSAFWVSQRPCGCNRHSALRHSALGPPRLWVRKKPSGVNFLYKHMNAIWNLHNAFNCCFRCVSKVKLYTPWRRLGGEEYSSYSFTTSALDGGEWSESRPGSALPPRKGPPVPIVQEAGWAPRAGLDTEVTGKILCPRRGSNPDRPVVQPVVRHYTAWANPAPASDV
jgi:hypothetical protein